MDVDKGLVSKVSELITTHEASIADTVLLINLYKKTYKDLTGKDYVSQGTVNPLVHKTVVKPPAIKGKKKTTHKVSGNNLLKNTVDKFLGDIDTLVPANKLRVEYNKVSGNNITVTNFSPRLAELKKNGFIGLYINKGADIENKFIYGLPRMFEDIKGGVLKPEYLEKVKAGQPAQLL
jgi:hypothetical protein